MLVDYEHLRDGLASQKGEAVFLYGLVMAIKPKICVETGSHKLYAAAHIANALEDLGGGHLYTADPFDYGQFEILETFSRGLKSHITYERIRGDQLKTPGKIDFAFIDGFHGKQDVLEEMDNIFPQLNENAIVVFHGGHEDPLNSENGVYAAIKERKLKVVAIPTLNWLQVYEHRTKNGKFRKAGMDVV